MPKVVISDETIKMNRILTLLHHIIDNVLREEGTKNEFRLSVLLLSADR